MVLYAQPIRDAILLPEENLRVQTREPVWVYWSRVGRNDVLPVRNLSLGGIFVETLRTQSVGTKAQINFLVGEGQIRTKAVVRHVERANGMGLEFTGVAQEDGPHLAALLTRLHGSSPSRPNFPG